MKHFTIREVADRSGVATSALRYYEDIGLLTSTRDGGGRRMYQAEALRRIAFISVGTSLGLTLGEIGQTLSTLPGDRAPTKRDWERVARRWREHLDARIDAMETMRARLTSCIGCGCLSLKDCSLANRSDRAADLGPGPRYLLGDAPAR